MNQNNQELDTNQDFAQKIPANQSASAQGSPAQNQDNSASVENQPTNAKQKSATDVLHFEKWLSILGQRKASDLHLLVGNPPMLRLDGKMVRLDEEEVVTKDRVERIADHLLTKKDLETLTEKRQLILGMTLKKTMRFRVHVFYNRGFLAFSFRYLHPEDVSLEQLGLPPLVSEFIQLDQGLLLVTGPFDSGKTTTIKSIVSAINHNQSRYVVMLEKPIEHIIPSDKSVIVQREVGRDVNSFSHGLEMLEDEDADVVIVSSVTDADTAEKAIHLANSGRLVIMVGVNERVIGFLEELRDMFEPRDQARILDALGSSLYGAVSQILLPKVGGGRVLITEVLRGTNPIKSLIKENKIRQVSNMMLTSRQEGMITLDKALEQAVSTGSITQEDASRYTKGGNQTNYTQAGSTRVSSGEFNNVL